MGNFSWFWEVMNSFTWFWLMACFIPEASLSYGATENFYLQVLIEMFLMNVLHYQTCFKNENSP